MANYHPDPAANNKSAPIIEVNASVMKNADGTLVDLKNTPQLRTWLIKTYSGKEITIKDDGNKVKFTTTGLKDSAKRRGIEQRQAYAAIDTLLENSIYDGYEDGDDRHKQVEKQNIYYAAARINGNNYVVRFKVDVFKTTGQMAYKDHKIVDIEIAPAMNTDANPNLSLYEGRIGALQNESVKMTTIKKHFLPTKVRQIILTTKQ